MAAALIENDDIPRAQYTLYNNGYEHTSSLEIRERIASYYSQHHRLY